MEFDFDRDDKATISVERNVVRKSVEEIQLIAHVQG
jgi:hypothetical protein